MSYAERRGRTWRVRYRKADGTYGSASRDPDTGDPFRSKSAAEKWGDAEEARVAAGLRPATLEVGKDTTFGQWVNTWWVRQDLALSTMANYETIIESRVLPYFESMPLAELTNPRVLDWERKLKAEGLAPATVSTYRAVLSVVLSDAAAEGLIAANPVYQRKGRGKRAGRSRVRTAEKAIATPLQVLQVAERAAAMTGRPDEFVFVVLLGWTGLRWGEALGLQRSYVRMGSIRVEHQVYELGKGWALCPPKEDSYRTIEIPPFLVDLLSGHMTRRRSSPTITVGDAEVCACYRADSGLDPHPGGQFVFTGRPRQWSTAAPGVEAPVTAHHRRSAFPLRVFTPAAEGRVGTAPVFHSGGAMPGIPIKTRGAAVRAVGEWEPIVPGLTPHGLRHSHKTWMVEDRVSEILSHERLGHEMGGIAATYTHVTDAMREDLMQALTARWNTAVEERFALSAHSSVPVVDELLAPLRERAARKISQSSPKGAVSPLRSRRRKVS